MADRDDPYEDDDEDPIRSLVEQGEPDEIRMFLASLSPQETADLLEAVAQDLREKLFPLLDLHRQATVLREVEVEAAREHLIESVSDERLADIAEVQRTDDATDLVEEIPQERRERVLEEIRPDIREEIEELGSYPPDSAGGLMQTELVRLDKDLTVAQAVEQFHKVYDPRMGDVYDIYVVDAQDHLLGRLRNRHLLTNPPERPIREFMRTDVRSVPVTMDQEKIADIVQDYDLPSIAVVDEGGRLVGRILVDDVVDVIEEEATEDIQKMGGTAALGESYLHIRLGRMVRKRAPWLAVLFLGETLTAAAMTHFEDDIARAVVLSLFVPLIISSGGNCGSQATTLVIRALATEDVRVHDWWRVVRREIATGAALGLILGVLGFFLVEGRHALWGTSPENPAGLYGEHHVLLATVVGLSLVGVVCCGTIAGAALPFIFKRLGFDPASASAPFVATFVDVTGLVIYFSVAYALLSGTLL